MVPIKPQLHVGFPHKKTEYIFYKTYKDLKKNLKKVMKENRDADDFFVVRYRRGQWGEWFERWGLDSSGKPVIIKQGWS